MSIIAKSTIRDFWILHPSTEFPLLDWYNKVKQAEWNEIGEDFKIKVFGEHQKLFTSNFVKLPKFIKMVLKIVLVDIKVYLDTF